MTCKDNWVAKEQITVGILLCAQVKL